MNVVRDSGWEERRVLICPRCAAALKDGRAALPAAILLAGNCGHPEPEDSLEPGATPVERAWPPSTEPVHARTRNALLRDGIETLGELARCPAADLMDIRNFGDACLAEVRRVLPLYGLALKGEGRAERAAS